MTATLRLYRPDEETRPVRLPRRHSVDFASVLWNGTLYTLTPAQGAAVRALWRAARNGTPDLRQETILEAAGSDGGRLSKLFEGHPAWGKLIVPGAAKGTFRLNVEGGEL